MSFRANRTAPRLLLLAGGVLLAVLLLNGCGMDETVVDGEERSFEFSGSQLEVDSDNSRLTLVPVEGLSGEVRVKRWFTVSRMGGSADITWEMDEDTLKLRTTCRGIVSQCSARHEIEVPADLPVRVTSRNGAVKAAGFRAGLELTSHNGAIDVTDAQGPLTLDSHNGRITATAVTTQRLRAASHNGAIQLELANAPAEIVTESHNGRTTMEVPGDVAYQVDVSTKNGKVDVSVDEGGDRHRISARSHNGGITVRPAEG